MDLKLGTGEVRLRGSGRDQEIILCSNNSTST